MGRLRLNVFRIGRWVTGAVVILYLAGCVKDIIFLEAWRADWLMLLAMIGLVVVGAGVIVGASWIIGRVIRWLVGVPAGLDSRTQPRPDVKAVFD